MVGGKVVTCLNVSVCSRNAVSKEEIQEVRYFVGVCGPVCRRPRLISRSNFEPGLPWPIRVL